MGARESTVTEIQNLLGWKRPSGSSSPTIIFARHLCPSASSLCLPPHFPSLFRFPILSSFSLLPPRAAALLCPWQAACRMADVHSSRLLCQEQSSPNAAAEWQLHNEQPGEKLWAEPSGRRAACFLCVWSLNCLFPSTFLTNPRAVQPADAQIWSVFDVYPLNYLWA